MSPDLSCFSQNPKLPVIQNRLLRLFMLIIIVGLTLSLGLYQQLFFFVDAYNENVLFCPRYQYRRIQSASQPAEREACHPPRRLSTLWKLGWDPARVLGPGTQHQHDPYLPNGLHWGEYCLGLHIVYRDALRNTVNGPLTDDTWYFYCILLIITLLIIVWCYVFTHRVCSKEREPSWNHKEYCWHTGYIIMLLQAHCWLYPQPDVGSK